MTPKEKAKELCDKFLRTYKVSLYPPFNSATQEAKECALIAVDEIIDSYTKEKSYGYITSDKIIPYWEEVKQEIEKL
jgi:hypothetical protein